MKLSDRVQAMQNSPIRKFNPMAAEAKAQGTKIYHLNIGQPDIETPPVFLEAIKNFDQKVLAYAESPGLPELQDAIIDYFKRFEMNLDRKNVLITSGGSEALTLVFLSLINPGDEVIVAEPYYTNYLTFIQAADGVVKPVTTYAEEGYKYAIRERLEKAVTDKTKMISLVNPGNPTGAVLTHEEMRMMVDIAKEYGLFIIGDEAYREFVYDGGTLQSLASFDDAAENVVVIDTVSKRFSACGARVGCILSRNKELMGEALKFCQARLAVATIDQGASAALYDVGPAYFAAVREEYKLRRDTVVAKLKEIPGVICECPKGAFYLMAALPVDDADAFQKWLLTDFDDNGDTVMFAPGGPFYATPGKGVNEIRIAYVLKQKDLERAMDLLAKGIAAYNARG